MSTPTQTAASPLSEERVREIRHRYEMDLKHHGVDLLYVGALLDHIDAITADRTALTARLEAVERERDAVARRLRAVARLVEVHDRVEIRENNAGRVGCTVWASGDVAGVGDTLDAALDNAANDIAYADRIVAELRRSRS